MEYLRVRFPVRRGVIVDNVLLGFTDQVLELEAGPHTIRLMPPPDFSPLSIDVDLTDTAPLAPCEITFTISGPAIAL